MSQNYVWLIIAECLKATQSVHVGYLDTNTHIQALAFPGGKGGREETGERGGRRGRGGREGGGGGGGEKGRGEGGGR